MQPITSAGISGIGHTPLGPVEGTWVVIMFRDDDEQQPIILGSIGGIPQKQGTIDQDDDQLILKADGLLPSSDGQTITDSNGNTIANTSSTPTSEDTGLSPASSYQPSEDAVNLIKQFEGLRLTSYQDSTGKWTIGYGTTMINGSPVQPGMTISEPQAGQYLLAHISTDVSPTISSKTKAPITQSMYDSLCCFTYNLGSGTFSNSSLLKEVNASKYLDAASLFADYVKAGGTVQTGLVRRRSAERELFLKDGVPSISGDLTPVNTPVNDPVESTTNPSGLSNNATSMVLGFKDPKGKYPLYLNEPDTNKLARNEDIKKTIVYKKEIAREKGVLTAQGKTWDQSPIPYNSTYPYNHVFMSESGHVMEFDDTENSERIHIYHKSGTFSEIDANGTQVNRIIGDKYEILERNGHVLIKGALDVTIDGDHNVLIKNALNIDVSGNVNLNVSGNMNTSVTGSFNVKAGSINLESTGSMNIYSGNSMNLQSAAAMNQKAAATWNVDASKAYTNSGTAGSANQTELTLPPVTELVTSEFTDLIVITRGVQAAAHYETPEEGDPFEYQAKQISDGTLDPDTINSGTPQASASAPANDVPPLPQSCQVISGMDKFTADLQLSTHFTLGSLTSNGTRLPVNQMGLTAQEIVCNLKGLAENCLEPIINLYPGMVITSGFRRPGDVAKSSATSQHYNGQAADIIIPGFNRQKHYEAIQAIQQLIPYDQLILEYSGATTCWIHVSFIYTAPRKMAFTMRDHQRYGSMGQYTLIA
jgi:GH24 family phage-related lysozyme (muramidase)